MNSQVSAPRIRDIDFYSIRHMTLGPGTDVLMSGKVTFNEHVNVLEWYIAKVRHLQNQPPIHSPMSSNNMRWVCCNPGTQSDKRYV